jgi:GNAT superfamily N-acetyltransferase
MAAARRAVRLRPPAHTSAFLEVALARDAPAVSALHDAAAAALTAAHGDGPWTRGTSVKWLRFAMTRAVVYVRREGGRIVATLSLSRRKPWSIDAAYFSRSAAPLYLSGMAVAPGHQGRGLGRRLLAELPRLARDWGADAVRLAAWDATAGAGAFYEACDFIEVGRATYRRAPLVYLEWRPR